MLCRMAHLHRFYIPPEPPFGPEIILPPEEAHHARRVLRVRPGDGVALFDGQGREILGTIEFSGKEDAMVHPESERRIPPPMPRLILAQAWLHRREAIADIVRHATELGASRVIFFRAARSEQAPKPSPKFERIAIEACKQCGRLWLPKIGFAADLAAILSETPGDRRIALLEDPPSPIGARSNEDDLTLIIGPEGDFSPEEHAWALDAGARPFSLGSATYRSETAAFLALALAQYEAGRLGPRCTDG